MGRARWDHQVRVAAATRCEASVWPVQRGEQGDRHSEIVNSEIVIVKVICLKN